jgi:hypothetical protein
MFIALNIVLTLTRAWLVDSIATVDPALVRPSSQAKVIDATLLQWSAGIALFLLVFQNMPFSQTLLGGFGSAASMPFVAVFAILSIARWLSKADAILLPLWVTVVILYIVGITIFGIIEFGFTYRGTSLVIKALLAAMQYGFFLLAFRLGIEVPRPWIAPIISAALIINTLGFMVIRDGGSTADSMNDVSFSAEPSHFGVMTVLLSLLFFYFSSRRSLAWLFLVISLIETFFSGSKGALASVALAFAVTMLIKNMRNPKFFALWVPIILIVSGGMLAIVYQMIVNDIENFASVATRSAGAITAGLISLDYPFGVGLGGFYPGFVTTIPQSWDILTGLLGSKINLSELFQFAFSDDRNLSSKSLFGDVLIYFGWPGVGVLTYNFFLMFRHSLTFDAKGATSLSIAVGFAWIAAMSYYVGIPLYVLPIVMGIIWGEVVSR